MNRHFREFYIARATASALALIGFAYAFMR
jgi:hypothetical protein